jgi:hypothetical protein
MGSGVEGGGEVSDLGVGLLCEQGIGSHLLVFAGFGCEATLDFLEKFPDVGAGRAEEEAGVDIGHAGTFLLEEQGFTCVGKELAEGVGSDGSEEDIDITPEDGFVREVLQASQDELHFLSDALEEFRREKVAGTGDGIESVRVDGESGGDGGQEPVAIEHFVS